MSFNFSLVDLFNIFTISILFELSVYHFIIYLGRTGLSEKKYNFYFSLFSLTLCLLILFDSRLINFFIKSPFLFNTLISSIRVTFAFFIVYTSINFISIILDFPDKRLKIFKIFFIPYFIAFSFTLFSIIKSFDWFMKYLYTLTLISVLLYTITPWLIFIYWIIKNKKYKSTLGKILFIGYLILAADYNLKNILPSFHIINPFENNFILTGIIIFIYAYALARKFNQEHRDLIELKKTLEQKVIERTQELETAKNEIEQKEQQRTTAFINIFHEIKNPLTIISNYLDKYINSKGATDDLIIVKRNIDKLKIDSNNFLDFEKLDHEMQFYNHSMIINLSDLAKMNILLFKEIANRKGIKFEFNIEEDLYIKADYKAIDKIFINLFDNAIKYTDISGKINIILKTYNNIIKFIISDTGIGISKNNLSHIFEEYYQISHEKSNRQGIGMGLCIVRKILDKLDAKIEVKSELSKGTSFTISFKKYFLNTSDVINDIIKDRDSLIEIVNIKLKEEQYKPDRYNLLIVEDNLEMLSYLQYSLCDKYNVYYAKNGKEALKKLNALTIKPNVIISDVMMDEMSGLELLTRLLDSRFKEIPFIFLTAKTIFEEKIKNIKSGAIDYIYKPFIVEELIAKIESIIKLQESQEEIQILNKKESLKNLYKKYKISKRGIEIIKLLNKGLEYRQIATKLKVSINTIGTHTKILFKKCHVINKSELLNIFKAYLE